MRNASKPTHRRVLTVAAAGLRRWAGWLARSPKAVVLVVAALAATVFAVTPAYADDPALNCAATAAATISVTPNPPDRQIINGTVHKIRTGISRRDLPER